MSDDDAAGAGHDAVQVGDAHGHFGRYLDLRQALERRRGVTAGDGNRQRPQLLQARIGGARQGGPRRRNDV